MVKLVDTQRSGRCALTGMGVRVPLSALLFSPHLHPSTLSLILPNAVSPDHCFLPVVCRLCCQFCCQIGRKEERLCSYKSWWEAASLDGFSFWLGNSLCWVQRGNPLLYSTRGSITWDQGWVMLPFVCHDRRFTNSFSLVYSMLSLSIVSTNQCLVVYGKGWNEMVGFGCCCQRLLSDMPLQFMDE